MSSVIDILSGMIRLIKIMLLILTASLSAEAVAQNKVERPVKALESTVQSPDATFNDKKLLTHVDSMEVLPTDSLTKRTKRNWQTWRPEVKRALWLALVIPGAGQIYNRKYWKLPIIYGGMVGCAYAMRWNNQMYHDYSQAYIDIMDDDADTHSYDQFLHLGNTITSDNLARYQNLFKQRKDRYRRWRDLSFFCLIAVYGLSVVDAYVDASLSEFDISKDLSLRVSPTVINNSVERNPLKANSVGLQCSLCF